MRTIIYVKHSGSCLPDQGIWIDISEGGGKRKTVTLTVDAFDSALISMLVCEILPTEYGIKAFRDDSDVLTIGEAWLTKPAECRLFVVLAGLTYPCQVVRLRGINKVAVTLEP